MSRAGAQRMPLSAVQHQGGQAPAVVFPSQLAHLFCLKPTLTAQPFPTPAGERKNQGPRLDVPLLGTRTRAEGVYREVTRPDLQPPDTNDDLASTRKGWTRPTPTHQHPVTHRWTWWASATILSTEVSTRRWPGKGLQHKPAPATGARHPHSHALPSV